MRKFDTNALGMNGYQITCDMCNINIGECQVDRDVEDIEICSDCGELFKNYMTDEERKNVIKSVKSIRNSRHIIDNIISKHLAKKIENDRATYKLLNEQKMKELGLVNPFNSEFWEEMNEKENGGKEECQN